MVLRMPVATGSTVVIVNPKARGGWVGKKWPLLEPVLREELGPLTVQFTTAPGHATTLSQEALYRGAALVLAMGGDGTASEVASGFLRGQAEPAQAAAGGPAFGYLPCGTGGDLRRTHQTPSALREAAQRVARATPRHIDAGQLDYIGHDGRPARTFFINIASFGIGGLVDALANESSKILGGTMTFFSASLRATLRYKNAQVALRLDDGPEREARIYNVVVANGRYFGGGMHIAPEAAVDDGQFDVVTLGDLTVLEAMLLGGPIYRGKHLGKPKVEVTRVRKLSARPLHEGDKVLLDVDGETPGRLPATFTVLPRALLLRV